MFGASGCQFVNAHAAVCGGDAPFGFDQFFLEEALESGIERAFFNLEKIVGGAFDVQDEGVTVKGLALEGAENHHFEGSGKEIAMFASLHGGCTWWRVVHKIDYFHLRLE
jgi:hypothetical protein